jgi:hypothetical protein
VLLLTLMLPKDDYGGMNFVAAGGFSPDLPLDLPLDLSLD